MFHPVAGHTGQKGSRGIALNFHELRTRCGCVFNVIPQPLYPRERPVTNRIGDWVALWAGLDRCGKSRPTGIDAWTFQPVASRYPGP